MHTHAYTHTYTITDRWAIKDSNLAPLKYAAEETLRARVAEIKENYRDVGVSTESSPLTLEDGCHRGGRFVAWRLKPCRRSLLAPASSR